MLIDLPVLPDLVLPMLLLQQCVVLLLYERRLLYVSEQLLTLNLSLSVMLVKFVFEGGVAMSLEVLISERDTHSIKARHTLD